MKKLIILFLLLTIGVNAQVSTGQEQEFDYGIKNNSAQTVTAPTYLVSNGTDGTYGKVLASNFQDVKEYASAINLPVTGVAGVIYVTKDNNLIYRWNGTIYQELSSGINGISTPEQFGAIGNGVADDKTAIQNAINSGKPILFTGSYYISGTITLSQKTQLLGNGKLIVNGDYPAIDIKSNDIVIDGLRFEGNGRGTATDYETTRSLQSGIKIFGAGDLSINYKNIQISNCYFYNLGGKAIDISWNYSSQHNGGALISDCFADFCFIGYYVGDRAEYSSFVNCKATNCEIGFNSLGGNNPLTGCNLDNNRAGVLLETGQNPGHSTITGGSINHSKSRAVWSNGEDGGYVFNGVEILVNGNIYIQNSDKIQFLNCNIIASTIDVISSTNTSFHNCKFDTTPTFTGLNAIEFFNTKWIGAPPTGFYDYLNNDIKLSNTPATMDSSSDLLVRQISNGSLKKLGYVPYNPSTYPVNSGGENISSVTARSGNNSSNIGLNGNALSAGGAAGWLTANGTASYGGGFISSILGVPKAYYYVSSGYAQIEASSGIGIKLLSSGAEALTIDTGGKVKIVNLSGTGDSAVGTDSAGNLKRMASTDSRPYKVYTALLTQSGTSAPVATVLENTLGGTIVWTRGAIGAYIATLSATFNVTKTFCLSGVASGSLLTSKISVVDGNSVYLATYNSSNSTIDYNANNLSVEIRVYN